jgi:hypothetical protein
VLTTVVMVLVVVMLAVMMSGRVVSTVLRHRRSRATERQGQRHR